MRRFRWLSIVMSLAIIVLIPSAAISLEGPLLSPHAPNVPDDLSTTSPTTTCNASADRPWIHDNSPVLRAHLSSDIDEPLRARFQWQHDDGSGFTESYKGVTSFTYPSPSLQRTFALSNLDDGRWRWRARAESSDKKSTWSEWCYFQLKTTQPASALVSISEPYVFDEWIDPPEGMPEATLTVDRNGDEDVVRFLYGINTGTPIHSVDMIGDTGALTFLPQHGLTTVSVRLVDRAGNVGPIVTEYLKILTPSIQHAWMLNEDTPGEAPDLREPADGGLPLSFDADVTWSEGNLAYYYGAEWDRALSFDGTGPGARIDGPVVSPTGSFTVTAKVRLDELSPDDDFVVASQGGGVDSAFNLGLRDGRWTAWGIDGAGADFDVVGSVPVDELGPGGLPFPDGEPDWQHLGMVYDATAGEIRFYVDGGLAGEMAYSFGAVADGDFRVGRGLAAGELTGDATGAVDDVVATNAALTAAAIFELTTADTADDLS